MGITVTALLTCSLPADAAPARKSSLRRLRGPLRGPPTTTRDRLGRQPFAPPGRSANRAPPPFTSSRHRVRGGAAAPAGSLRGYAEQENHAAPNSPAGAVSAGPRLDSRRPTPSSKPAHCRPRPRSRDRPESRMRGPARAMKRSARLCRSSRRRSSVHLEDRPAPRAAHRRQRQRPTWHVVMKPPRAVLRPPPRSCRPARAE